MAVSMNIIDELQWRALTHQCTDLAAVTKELESSTVLYAGFDPTSDSLHNGEEWRARNGASRARNGSEEWGQPAIYGDGLVFSLSYPQ